jgi:hypothetical protein
MMKVIVLSPIISNDIMLKVIILVAIIEIGIMLNAIMPRIIILNVIILSVIQQNVAVLFGQYILLFSNVYLTTTTKHTNAKLFTLYLSQLIAINL